MNMSKKTFATESNAINAGNKSGKDVTGTHQLPSGRWVFTFNPTLIS